MNKNTKLIISVGVIAAILFTILYITYVVEAPNDTTGLTGDITIGTLLPLTGDFSSQGVGDKAAIDMAANDFNEYLDKNNADWQLKIVHEDSETSPVSALEKVTSLHARNIDLIVGPTSSGELQNIMAYVESNNVLIFSPSSTAPSLAIPGDTVYRLTPDDTKQGPAIAALLDDNDIDTIIQLVRDDAWGEGLSKTIEESFLDESGHVSQIIRFNPDSPEFLVTTSLLAKAVNDKVAINGGENIGVVIIGFAEVLQFMQSATEYEILGDVMWFGTDGSTNDEKITNDSLGSEFADKVQFTSTLLAVSDNDIRKDIEQRLVSQTGKTPKSYAYSAYDIVWILGLSIEEAGSNNVDKVTEVISDIAAGYNGAVGNARLNEAGDLHTSNYDIWQVSDGTWNNIGYYNSDRDVIVELVIGEDHHVDSLALMENEIKIIVEKTKSEYDDSNSLDSITNLQFGEYYSFVLSGDLNTILVHPNQDAVGVHPTGINNADIAVDEILEILKTEDGVWVKYVYTNPATGNDEDKRSWLSMHDGYVFAAGYYNPEVFSFTLIENEIKIIVEKTKSQYDEGNSLDSITQLQFGEYYSFVVSGNMDEVLVFHDETFVGKPPTAVNNADISVEEIIEILKTEDGVWIEYDYLNPVTGNDEHKKTWLSMHKGYMFAAGYYYP